ncbi:Pentatricopeptide repeat-containing protein [Arachis hypogaea]|nr:Pentatricopeptide repeat-containing protein [Arachis hypogaea]
MVTLCLLLCSRSSSPPHLLLLPPLLEDTILSSSISFLLLFSTFFSRSLLLLDQLGHSEQVKTLVFEVTSKLESRNRELALFYCKLLESHSKRGSPKGFDIAYCYMNHLFRSSSSVYIKRRAFEYMVSGLCAMDRPREVEDLVEDLRSNGGAIDLSCNTLTIRSHASGCATLIARSITTTLHTKY